MRYFNLLFVSLMMAGCSSVPDYLIAVDADEKSFSCNGSSTYRNDLSSNGKITNVYDGKPIFIHSYVTLINRDAGYICEYWEWNGVDYKYEFAVEGVATGTHYSCSKTEKSQYQSRLQEIELDRKTGIVTKKNIQYHCDVSKQQCLLVASEFTGTCNKSSNRPSYTGINKKL